MKLQTVEDIKTADQQALKQLYQAHRGEFGAWVGRYYNADEDLAGEIYQQAFIAFYYNIRDGRVTTLSSSVKTYLFAIGKNIAREQLRHQARFVPEEDLTESDSWDTSLEESIALNERQKALQSVLDKIGEPCRTVLKLYYYENYSMAAIADTLNYKTEQIAAKRKFICLQQIRKLLKESGHLNVTVA